MFYILNIREKEGSILYNVAFKLSGLIYKQKELKGQTTNCK